MRITAGRHRGRKLAVPPGRDLRPTADRTRQALFNILEHGGFKPGGGSPIRGAYVLDAFAGTGALGLEALSRGAEHVVFMDTAPAALDAVRANVAACREAEQATILRADATRPPSPPTPRTLTPALSRQGRGSPTERVAKKKALSPGGRGLGEGDPTAKASGLSNARAAGQPARIAFLDPPYNSGLAAPALTALAEAGWLAEAAICVVEIAADEAFTPPEGFETMDERRYGAARVVLVGYGGG